MLYAILPLLLFGEVLTQECGTIRPADRIVGGEKVGILKYPWFAMLRAKLDGDPPVCAGTLITQQHVLTAAHCFGLEEFADVPYKDHFNVAFGVYDWCAKNESHRETYAVSSAVIHENYTFKGDFWDIAVMTLKDPVDIEPCCLPDSSINKVSEPAHIAGWGILREKKDADTRDVPCEQREANVTLYTKEQCGKTKLPKKAVEDPGVVCAGANGTDTCEGDSGGPLLTYNEDGTFKITGIVSFGYGCAQPNLPGVYTSVPYYLEWIAEKIGATVVEEGSPPPEVEDVPNRKTMLIQRRDRDAGGRGFESRAD